MNLTFASIALLVAVGVFFVCALLLDYFLTSADTCDQMHTSNQRKDQR